MFGNMFGKSKKIKAGIDLDPSPAQERAVLKRISEPRQVERSAVASSTPPETISSISSGVECSAVASSTPPETISSISSGVECSAVASSTPPETISSISSGVERSAVASSTPPETISSIGSGVSIVGKIAGKIVGNRRLSIFGQVEGEIHGTAVEIGIGAQIEGNIVAEDLTIDGRVKGTIHSNRV